MDISSEFRAVSGYADLQLVASANCADLVVVGQADPGRTRAMATPSNLAEQVALHAACPVMVVPHVGVRSAPGKTVLLCWKQTREAARAVTAALPILKTATKVMALAIGTGKSPARDPEPGTELVHWLGRHGVTVSVRHEQAVDDDIGAMILSDAADHGADLIVMGAYGHSRLRELVLGGVSRTLFGSMTVPLLVAH
jgi:nucleotide-binding universal stress UspA family protein